MTGSPIRCRTDGNTNMSERFGYNGLSRLTTSTVSLSPTPLVKTFSCSAIGNLLSKSDVRDSAAMASRSMLHSNQRSSGWDN